MATYGRLLAVSVVLVFAAVLATSELNAAPQATAAPAVAQQPQRAQSLLGPPPIEFHPPVLDLGTIRPNQRTSGTVYIHNISDNWLKVVHTKADCSCTSVNLANTMIAPGQNVPLEAEYHSNSVMGDKKGAVRVLIDGYDMVELPVKAFVTMPVRAEPPFVAALPDASGKTPQSGEFEVISNDQKVFRVLAVNGNPPQYVDFNPASDQPRNRYRMKWDFTEYHDQTCVNKANERMPGWVVIETDHPECPVFDLEVRHNCNRRSVQRTDTWIVQEKRVLLGGMKAGEPVEFEVVAKWRHGASTADVVRTVISESRQFTAELLGVEPVEDGTVCRMRVTPSANHQGMVYGAIRLFSHQQNTPLMVIGTVR